MKLIKRNRYIKQLEELRETDVIKVLTGVRRCGKSTIFQQYMELLKGEVDAKNVVFINFEDYSAQKYIKDPMLLHEEIVSKAEKVQTLYVFFDEVQNLPDFQRIIDSLHLRSNIDLYITGSNAYLLSNELATLFAGRYIEIHVLPFSFAEYVEISPDDKMTERLFLKYMENGGMPGIVNIPAEQTDKYLHDVFESAMRKDILQRNKWQKNNQFDKTLQFMFDSIGSPVSVNNIVQAFSSQSIAISHHTVDRYLDAMLSSYLFYSAPRYDIKGKNILKTNEKFYTCDLGFANALIGRKTGSNLGHRLENIVYIELLRRYKQVFVGKAGEKEIDFVAIASTGQTEYFQVAYTVRDEATLKRELAALRAVKNFNRRTLLTMDLDPDADYEGIEKRNVIDWLLDV
jgi:predicted AAA+ superfamily ATPase